MKYRTLILFFVTFVLYTVIDILMWQRIFEENQLWDFIPQYKKGWFMVLVLVMVTGSVAIWDAKNSLWFVFAMWISAWTGLEDVLYYLLDLRKLPEYFHWLEGSKLFFGYDKNSVIATVIFWQTIVFGSFFYMRKYDKHPPYRRTARTQPDRCPQ